VTALDDYKAAVVGRGVQRVYKLNEVPASPVYPYAVVSMGAPDKVSRTLNGAAADLHRGVTQYFGRDIDGVLDLATLGDLDGTFLNGRLVTREVSSPPFRDPDDQGVLAVTLTYQF
jgi:hypothetical protein